MDHDSWYTELGIGTFETSKKDHDGMVMPIDEVDPLYSKSLVFIREALKS